MSWFRMYHEARTDNKLRALSDAQHRCWFNLMCLAAEQDDRGTISGYDDDLLAIEVANGDGDLVRATLALLCRLRIVTAEGGCIAFVNWGKRQYDKPSDSPERVKERVDRYRGTEEAALPDDGNAPVTLGNAQIRREEKREEETRGEHTPALPGLVLVQPGPPEPYSPQFEAFWRVYPRRLEKKAAWRQWLARVRGGVDPLDLIAAAEHYAVAKHRQQAEPRHIKHAATFIGQDEHFRDWVAGVPPGEDRGPAGTNGRYERNLDGLYAAGSRIGFEEGA